MAFFAPKPPPAPVRSTESPSTESSPMTREPVSSATNDTALTFDAIPAAADSVVAPPALEERITVDTPLYTAVFSTKGGGLVDFHVHEYVLADGTPLRLVENTPAQPVLRIDPDGTGPAASVSLENTMFRARTAEANGLAIGEIVFFATSSGGIEVERRYRFRPDDYTMDLAVSVNGLSAAADAEQSWVWSAGLPFTERDAEQDRQGTAAIVRVGENFEQKGLKDVRRGETHTYEGAVQWAATRGKYFISGLFASAAEPATRAMIVGDPSKERVGYGITFPIHEGSDRAESRLYVGPIEQVRLVALGEGIDKKVGIKAGMFLGSVFGWLATGLHTMLVGLYKIIPNYGIAILIIAIVSKAAFFPLTRKGTMQMKAMAALKPELDALRDRHKDDQQKLGMETMALYKKHGVNPAAGCLPLLIQMPVFFALYGVLRGAIELRQAPFVGWISDLSSPDVLVSLGKVPLLPDNLCVLPLLMAASTILMQKSTMMSDPRQRTLMYMMPVMMLFFFYNLPAGLNLYWTAQNLLSWAEQALSKGITTPTTAKAA
jgi:YidC/Oxa1 family membrane protein insertase